MEFSYLPINQWQSCFHLTKRKISQHGHHHPPNSPRLFSKSKFSLGSFPSVGVLTSSLLLCLLLHPTVKFLLFETMKTAFLLSVLCASVQSFSVVPSQSRVATQLYGQIPKEEMSADQLEILSIQEKWSEIRLMDREEAQSTLEGEWLEAYNRFYEKYDDDMTRMEEIAEKLQVMIEPPKVQKKTKGQKKRDAYAKVLAREAARAED